MSLTRENDALENEERLRFALVASNCGIWDWNIATGNVYYSASWKRLFGFTEDDALNSIHDWESRVHPDDKAKVKEGLQTQFKSNEAIYESCYRFRAKDGTYRWIQARREIVSRDANGTPLRMIGTNTDITKEKESSEQYRRLFNLTPLPTWIYDFETLRFLAVNQAAINSYGYTKEEFLAMTILDVRHPAQQGILLNILQFREDQQTASYFNWSHKKKNGAIINVTLNSTTITYDGRKARLIVVNDITDKVAAEAELNYIHQRFKYASKASSDVIYDWNIETDNIVWSEGMTALFGYDSDNVLKRQWEEYIHPGDQELITGSLYATLYHSRKKFWKVEYRFLQAKGQYRYILEKGFILRDSANKPVRMIGAMQDITNLKQQQFELAESNKRYEYATLATADVIWDWLVDDDKVLWSENYEKITGWKLHSDKRILVQTCIDRCHESDRDLLLSSMREALQNPKQHVWEAQLKYVKSNGGIAHVHKRAYILRNESGTAVRMIGAMQDVTKSKKLEEKLLKEELNKQKEISKATIETQEQERSEIGKELHDNVNQVLTTTKLYVELAQSHAELKDELLVKAQNNIVYVINEIRQLSRSLMNPSLGDLGLVDSIQDLLEGVRATRKLHVFFDASGPVAEPLPDNLKLTIYRIIQEALKNVLTHAQATKVSVFISRAGTVIELRITDDGIGFDPAKIRTGAGLKNIKNRVYLMNGRLHLESKPGAGCHLDIRFNLKNTINLNREKNYDSDCR